MAPYRRRRSRPVRLALAAAVALAAGAVAVPAVHAATPATAATTDRAKRPHDDFNGDGCPDPAVGAPADQVSRVLVLRGSANGLTGSGAKVFSQNTGGVPGVAEKGDAFGAQTALVDAKGDKKAELAVGDPAENANNGAVWIFPGTSGGITARGTFVFGAAKVGAPATGVRFGASLTG
ncbi:FG-GAP repeat protein [Streptomyces sp. NPDC047043]|uniref:FG-GAP repeat protein n=1 Tax=Streptomyces sp. NPDC047043 TaxID=3154497 RepID=UPI00341041A0